MKIESPRPGYYYHYKHDPQDPLEKYAYHVLNIGHHTEIDGEDGLMIVYRPLYTSAYVYQHGKMWDVRPLKMAIEPVDKPEYKGPRFIPITDESVITQLKKIEKEMYEE
jgi:hypothetical protein